MINGDTVRSIALLARLELSEKEVETTTTQLNAILEYMEKLNELDTSKIVATSHAVAMETPMRPDEMETSEVYLDILNQAPEAEENFFRVPKVL